MKNWLFKVIAGCGLLSYTLGSYGDSLKNIYNPKIQLVNDLEIEPWVSKIKFETGGSSSSSSWVYRDNDRCVLFFKKKSPERRVIKANLDLYLVKVKQNVFNRIKIIFLNSNVFDSITCSFRREEEYITGSKKTMRKEFSAGTLNKVLKGTFHFVYDLPSTIEIDDSKKLL